MVMKNRLHKFLFPNKVKEIEVLKKNLASEIAKEHVEKLITRAPTEESLVQYCLKNLGIPVITAFSEVDSEGDIPHYLAEMNSDERKNFIAHLETIYTDDKFQTIVSYVINLIANYAIQKADKDKMHNGRMAIIGVNTFIHEFKKAHDEYVDSRKQEDTFDPLAVLPE